MGMFGGGSSAPAEASPQAAAPQQQNSYSNNQQDANCAAATKQLTNCLEEHGGNMSICGWYMEQVKACQAAASHY